MTKTAVRFLRPLQRARWSVGQLDGLGKRGPRHDGRPSLRVLSRQWSVRQVAASPRSCDDSLGGVEERASSVPCPSRGTVLPSEPQPHIAGELSSASSKQSYSHSQHLDSWSCKSLELTSIRAMPWIMRKNMKMCLLRNAIHATGLCILFKCLVPNSAV